MPSSVLSSQSILYRNPEMVFSKVDEETVMMSVENGEYYGLDPVASRIWELLAERLNLQQLIEKLMEEYEVDYNTCFSDVSHFVQELLEKKIIFLENASAE